MDTGTVLVLAIVVPIVGTVAVMLFRAWQRANTALDAQRARRSPFPGFAVLFEAAAPVKPEKLSWALEQALACAAETAPLTGLNAQPAPVWTREQMLNALAGWCVVVRSAENWVSKQGETVGGETDFTLRAVYVGPSLAGLAHELLHVFEDVIENRVDYKHATWPARAFYRVVAEYQRRLRNYKP